LLSFLKQHRIALLWSAALHGFLLAVVTVSFFRDPLFADAPAAQDAIEATVVDAGRIEEEIRKLEEADQQALREQEAEEQRAREEAAQARREQEEEARRLEELRDQREAALAEQQQREADQAAERERQVTLDAERKAQAERDRQEAAEQEAELRRQQEAERERLAELERQRKEEEARLARLEEERLEQERQRREAEEARRKAAAEAALRNEIEAEQQLSALQSSPMAAQYRTQLQQHIQRQWIKPPSAQPGIECEVHVTQIPSGDVTDVRIGACNGDAAVIRSIEAAVHRASPLPRPPDPNLFERNLQLVFQPDS